MIQKSLVMRKCISCRTTFDRENLLKITHDKKLGIMLNQGMGRSAYICKSKKCYKDSKIRKKLQRLSIRNFYLTHNFVANLMDNYRSEKISYLKKINTIFST